MENINLTVEELEYIKGWQEASLSEINRRCTSITTGLIHNLTWLSVHAEGTFERVLLALEQHNQSLHNIILHEVMCNLAGV